MLKEYEKPRHQRMIEGELVTVLNWLKTSGNCTSDEYLKTLTVVERLHKMTDREQPSTVSKDVLVGAATNLLGIFLILQHERFGAVTSRALGFVLRAR